MQRKEMRDMIDNFFKSYPVTQTELAKASGVTINTISEIILNKMPETKLQSRTIFKLKAGMAKWEK